MATTKRTTLVLCEVFFLRLLSLASRFFVLFGVINGEKQGTKKSKIQFLCYIIMAMAGVVVGDGSSSTAVGAAEFGDVR